jgi:WG containing repeat
VTAREKLIRISGALVLIALTAKPCSMFATRTLWTKKPASELALFAFERDGKVGFIDASGKIVIDPVIQAAIEEVGDFSNRLARVNGLGYIDPNGNVVIKREAKAIVGTDFADGVAQVVVDDPNRKYEHLTLIIDAQGKTLASVRGLQVEAFSEGLAAYEADHKHGIRKFGPGAFVYLDFPGPKGFIDHAGRIAVEPTFADVGPFVGGLARAVLDGYCHIVTPDNGKQGSPTSGFPTSCGGAPEDAVSPCRVGFIDHKGKFVIAPHFEAAQDFAEDLAAVRVDARWGFIDRSGAMAITPQFEQVQSFREGLAALRSGDKWGFIDRAGIVTIPPQFDDVEPFSDSLALVHKDQKPLYIDRGGRTQIAGAFREATSFVHGLAAVLIDAKHVAYIDHSGKIVFDYFRH